MKKGKKIKNISKRKIKKTKNKKQGLFGFKFHGRQEEAKRHFCMEEGWATRVLALSVKYFEFLFFFFFFP